MAPSTELVNGMAYLGTHHHENGDAATNMASTLKRYPETGISVLIVGSGIGGLMSALECWRKGHSVQICERSSGPVYTGDNLTIQPSALSILRHWPELCKEIEEEHWEMEIGSWTHASAFKTSRSIRTSSQKRNANSENHPDYKHTGEHIYGPNPPSFNDTENIIGRKGPHVAFMQSRVKFYKSLIRQAQRLGLLIEYHKRVVSYYEDDESGTGGVVLESGERREADVVVAADGIKTRSGRLISGDVIQPKESGMAIYRSAYPTEHALSEPQVKARWDFKKGDRPIWEFWLGPGLHVLVVVTDDIDDGSASESWTPDVEPAEVLQVMEREAPGWHPAVAAIMKTAPRGTIIHWKLMWRDLCEDWTSPAGRVVQVGDSAHSFLPSSGNGASQAMEDAITLATCLQLGGKSNISSATKVYNKLRYERVSCAQKMSFVNSQIKHQTDWAAVEKNPKLIRTRFPRWIYQHDPEAYAYEKFNLAFHHVLSGGGANFQNTNFPPGHVFKRWTMEEVMEEIKAGKSVEALLDGDWS
uniref:Putative 6-hydroxynicotinate 3-monooxygenase n=1 Tax=Cladonia uncialis subsp. uncialis TaxID=180999 RepID=A0A1Z1CC55_CLAUC|nr:putative 6-hydroxynicotinate 3-monooxygenase [Cladonia uncialis subsp. uncialis]AUW31216.1 putative monooxygenase [Cladonia uncialis subsp. uncialis]